MSLKRKVSKIGHILALSVVLILCIPLFPTPTRASEYFFIYPYEGEIGTRIEIDGRQFRENDIVYVYFSSQKAEIGGLINEDVTAYKKILHATTDAEGFFDHTYISYIPDVLNDGDDVEDVHDGVYYFYAVYYRSYKIAAVADFIVLNGEISLDIYEDVVGTEVEISGIGLRPDQTITIEYDGNAIPISSGDSQTDENGNFICTIIISESPAGSHFITAVDESGNTPEIEFTVIPMITINPSQQSTGGEVHINGTGFAIRENILITLGGEEVMTNPSLLSTDRYGSFEGSFLVPLGGSYGTRTTEARDDSANQAQAQLDIRGGIMLTPTTSFTSPGYAGMDLSISGTGFTIGSTVAITYSNNAEDIPIATVTADRGTFQVEIAVPPSAAGSHDITASDGTSTATATFIMESQAPPTPTPLTPKVAGTAGTRAYFDWSDTSDDSGISYTLQVALDPDFNYILLNKQKLEDSEYKLTEEEELETTQKDTPYYWRVKTVDGAFNDSDWTYPQLFYVGFSWSSLPAWAWYVFGIAAAVVLGALGYWLWGKKVRDKTSIT